MDGRRWVTDPGLASRLWRLYEKMNPMVPEPIHLVLMDDTVVRGRTAGSSFEFLHPKEPLSGIRGEIRVNASGQQLSVDLADVKAVL